MLRDTYKRFKTGGTITNDVSPNNANSKIGNYIEEGGTHEENPLTGVPAGGNNMVEQGEYIFTDPDNKERYVFSNRLGYDMKGSFARKAKSIDDKFKNWKNDSIVRKDMVNEMKGLKELHEKYKNREDNNKFANGGRLNYLANKGTMNPVNDYEGDVVRYEDDRSYGINSADMNTPNEFSPIRQSNNSISNLTSLNGLMGNKSSNKYNRLYSNKPNEPVKTWSLMGGINEGEGEDNSTTNEQNLINTRNSANLPITGLTGKNVAIQNDNTGKYDLNAAQVSNNAVRTGDIKTDIQNLSKSYNSGNSTKGKDSYSELTPDYWKSAEGLVPLAGNLAANAWMFSQAKENPVNFQRVNAPKIDLSREREIAQRMGDTSRNVNSRSLRNMSSNSGEYLANIGSLNPAVDAQVGDSLARSYQTEENTNANAQYQADATNSQIGIQEDDARAREKGAVLAQKQAAIQSGLSGLNQYTNNIAADKSNVLHANMIDDEGYRWLKNNKTGKLEKKRASGAGLAGGEDANINIQNPLTIRERAKNFFNRNK